MEQTTDAMMKIIKSAVLGMPVNEELVPFLTQDFLFEMFEISNSHDMAHLIGTTLDKYDLLPDGEIANYYREKELKAIYRYESLKFEYTQICELLEKSEIKFMPLKGAIMCDFYPEAWMRTSCDVDILVQKKDLKKAENVLKKELGYNKIREGSHDVTFCSSTDIHIELHYDLVEENTTKKAYEVLKNVWVHSHLKEKYKYFYVMNAEMFCFYHIAHTAKHFVSGGCGIRPLLDLWIMNNKTDFWNSQTEKLLKQGDLLRFAYAIRSLSEVWFSCKEHDNITFEMQSYILQGGVYGTEENLILMRNQRAGGRYKYILSRIFVPYVNLKYEFPVIRKYRFLTPVYEVYRWILFVFNRNKKSKIERLNSIKHIPEENIEKVAEMMEKIGL